jgi:hypothetical protein
MENVNIEGLLNKKVRPDYPDTSLGATQMKAQVGEKRW